MKYLICALASLGFFASAASAQAPIVNAECVAGRVSLKAGEPMLLHCMKIRLRVREGYVYLRGGKPAKLPEPEARIGVRMLEPPYGASYFRFSELRLLEQDDAHNTVVTKSSGERISGMWEGPLGGPGARGNTDWQRLEHHLVGSMERGGADSAIPWTSVRRIEFVRPN